MKRKCDTNTDSPFSNKKALDLVQVFSAAAARSFVVGEP